MKATLVLLLALAAVAQICAQHPAATLKEAKLDKFAAIADAAGALDELSSTKARVTVLAPTDAAVDKFLKDMGLTMDDVKKNPTLARNIVAYHTIVGVAAGPKELFAKGDKLTVQTNDPHHSVTFVKKGDGVLVRDFQGNEAKVTKASLGKGKHTVHVVDKVLYSGSYFKSLADVLKLYPSLFSTAAAATTKAGLGDVAKQSFPDTIFLPTNAAFKKAGIDVEKTDKATLEKVLKNHVVPTRLTIPDGFKSGKSVATADKGSDLTVAYKNDETESKVAGLKARRAFVTDGKGTTAMVIKPNLIIGPAVAHVIDNVLLPKPAGVSTEKAAAAPKAAAAAAPKADAPKATTTGRKLLNGGAGGGMTGLRAEYDPTLSADAAEQAISSAVNVGASAGATRGAAVSDVANVEVNTIWPEHGSYADGVRGSFSGVFGN